MVKNQFDAVGLMEMTSAEIQSTNGGLLTNPVWLVSALIALGASIINNWGDVREGWADGNSNRQGFLIKKSSDQIRLFYPNIGVSMNEYNPV